MCSEEKRMRAGMLESFGNMPVVFVGHNGYRPVDIESGFR